MTEDPRQEGLERLERTLGIILLAGVRLSATLLAAGLLLWVATGSAGRGATPLLHAGLICLMATPILRVLVSFAEYVRERDWFFVLATLAVIAILAGTLLAALVAA